MSLLDFHPSAFILHPLKKPSSLKSVFTPLAIPLPYSLKVNHPSPAAVEHLTARLARHDNKGSDMFKRGLLLALCATVLSGCIITPAHLRVTPPRVDVVYGNGYYYNGGYYNGYNNGGYNNGGHHHHHDR
jgi:hypothetical protein